jgi:hypothetical protein
MTQLEQQQQQQHQEQQEQQEQQQRQEQQYYLDGAGGLMLDGHEVMYGLGLERGEGKGDVGSLTKVPSVTVGHASSSNGTGSSMSSSYAAQGMMMLDAGKTHAQEQGDRGQGGSNGKLSMGGGGGRFGDVASSTGSSTSSTTSSSSFKKQPWTPEEDEHLRLLVQRFGPRDWTKIAEHLYQRNGKQ